MNPAERTPHEVMVAGIEAYMQSEGITEEGWALGDWVILVELMPYTPELKDRMRYVYITPEPTIPLHRLMGLVQVVGEQIDSGDTDAD